MTSAPDWTELVEELRRAMDELGAPDLTLARGEVLRPRVHRLLEALRDRRGDDPRPRISARVIGRG